ncbi:MAG: helix-turn-helix domain-containing protein [Defluviitoga tunisiensis]
MIKIGRKVKLTEEKIKTAVRLAEHGNTIKNIYGALGISKQTWYNWLDRGKKAKSGIYRKFYEEIEAAESRAEARFVTIISKAAEEEWQAAAWWLERKYPERWGKKDRFAFEGDEGMKIVIKKVDASNGGD